MATTGRRRVVAIATVRQSCFVCLSRKYGRTQGQDKPYRYAKGTEQLLHDWNATWTGKGPGNLDWFRVPLQGSRNVQRFNAAMERVGLPDTCGPHYGTGHELAAPGSGVDNTRVKQVRRHKERMKVHPDAMPLWASILGTDGKGFMDVDYYATYPVDVPTIAPETWQESQDDWLTLLRKHGERDFGRLYMLIVYGWEQSAMSREWTTRLDRIHEWVQVQLGRKPEFKVYYDYHMMCFIGTGHENPNQ